MAPTIVTRAQWGARSPRGVVSTTSWSNRVGVAIHHSAGPTSQTVRQIQDHQMDNNGWQDIGYNWLVTQDGRLWEGRLHTWTAIGAHAGGQNTAWVGVCWIGTSGNTTPSSAALATIRWVVDEARRRAGRALQVRGHGQVPGQATECPGSRLRAWIAAGMPTEEDDMTPAETYEAVWERDGMPAPAGYSESNWRASSVLRSAHLYSRRAYERAAEILAGQAAVLAAVKGEDAAQAAAAAARDTIRTEFARLGPALAAELADVPAEQIEAALRSVLGSLDEGGV